MLRQAGISVLSLACASKAPRQLSAKSADGQGLVVGHVEGARTGMDVLAAGGNAVDAAVAAALTAGVVGVHLCGIGGYGGHMVIAVPGGKKVTAIDFNSTAPRAAREDMFPLTAKGDVKDGVNNHGWLAAGVPGTLAGLQLAIDRFGTRRLGVLMHPAIRLAREGFAVSKGVAAAFRNAQSRLRLDSGAARLFLREGEPLPAGALYRNRELADMLQALAEANSVASFYAGPIAQKIAAAFKNNGGLVTAADLEAYRAREVAPLRMSWNDFTICTAPLTAGGHTVLQALTVLQLLNWAELRDALPSAHMRLEALRLAWNDRLHFLGDPDKAKVPWERLLAHEHIKRLARQVEVAVKDKKPTTATSDGRHGDGTVHLSAVDANGMMVALTLTHGGSLGAQVTVGALGLLLGHGMSRFEPRAGHPNSPGAGKRPLHNMCPTIVLRSGKPELAVGGVGGRKIPNAIFEVLAQYVGRGSSLDKAMAAGRIHTEGDKNVTLDPAMTDAETDYLKTIGYTIKRGASASANAVAIDCATGERHSAAR